MRKISMMPILVLAMALGFVSCSASDDGVNDGMLGQQTTTFMPSFSMLSYNSLQVHLSYRMVATALKWKRSLSARFCQVES